jgi:RimJ/RimL family protein N-acetyltransferase
MATAAGSFHLRPVDLAGDLGLLVEWMNDPAVDAYWELAGPAATTRRHVEAQLGGDSHSLPCLGFLDGVPTGYFELYRADLDPLARHYPALPEDIGIHLLLGPAESRGRGLGGVLLDALAARILHQRPRCHRVVAEPDVRNTASVRAFQKAGFERTAELALPTKRAALMIRRR